MRSAINSFIKTCDICQRVKGLLNKQKLTRGTKFKLIWLVHGLSRSHRSGLFLCWLLPVSIPFLTSATHAAITINPPFMFRINSIPYGCHDIHAPSVASTITELNSPHLHSNNYFNKNQNVTTTVKKTQANSVIERMHLSFGQLLRSILAGAKINNNEQHSDLLNSYIDTALSSSLYAINSAINSTTKVFSGAFIFQRDMLLPIQCITNWEFIRH